VPGKNLALVGGRSLLARTITAAQQSRLVSQVVVSTDGSALAAEARRFGAVVVDRPPELAGDTASSEAAWCHAINQSAATAGQMPEFTVMLQATSPFTTPEEIDAVVRAVTGGAADSAFSAAAFGGFVWRLDQAGPEGVNHAYRQGRQRRQDRPTESLETGAVYAAVTAGLLASGNRFFGRVAAVQTDPRRVFEVDDAAQLAWADRLAPLFDSPVPAGTLAGPGGAAGLGGVAGLAGVSGTAAPGHGVWPQRHQLDAIVLDFDGVLTPNTALVLQDGREAVLVNRSDGLAVAALRRAGLKIVIISGESNPVVRARAAKLAVECLDQVLDKAAGLLDWAQRHRIDLERVLYLGNEVNDLPALRLAGWPVAVGSAAPEVVAAARAVTEAGGGQGAVRELAARILGEQWWQAGADAPSGLARAPAEPAAGDVAGLELGDGVARGAEVAGGGVAGLEPGDGIVQTAEVAGGGVADLGPGDGIVQTAGRKQPRPANLARRLANPKQPVYLVAEIGINHNGSLDLALRLIEQAQRAGFDAVKFQKRTPEIALPQAQWDKPRETPWGELSYIEYRRRIELSLDDYRIIDQRCRELGLDWFASPWDLPSLEFLSQFDLPAIKIASACLTDDELLDAARRTGRCLIASTGMSTWSQIEHAVSRLDRSNLIICHATSTYPAPVDELGLGVIETLRQAFPGVPIGYSGHEVGLSTTVAAVALGARLIERHITLDRSMWGSDQAASVEPAGMIRLVRDIRTVEQAIGDGIKLVYPSELDAAARLRRHN
jgi:YrbI family 3-deoxy-D-manno-octulosonate 8-phosphate phosphatase